mmetsp:Transcript_19719/g.35009  ORF Transcript_19719/g.35009 Transcript_19719/m.35009 type:complete len:290 (-) Transcript_19719:67-936(-)
MARYHCSDTVCACCFFAAFAATSCNRYDDDHFTLDTVFLYTSPCETERIAVVSNFNHSKNLKWLYDAGFKVHEVGLTSAREIGESIPWVSWIVDNYDSLPEEIMFLHGDQQSWHHAQPMDADYLCHVNPGTMLSDHNCVWAADLPKRIPREIHGLDMLYQAFWNLSFAEAFDSFRMAKTFICCTENVVSRGAIQRLSKQVYQQLLTLMEKNDKEPWGWIFERTLQNLFVSPIAPTKTSEQIIESLASQSSAKDMSRIGVSLPSSALDVKHATDTSIQAILTSAAACGPM